MNCQYPVLVLSNMIIKSLLLLFCLLSSSVFAETVYKTVDDDGNIIFSDKPSEGAEAIVIKEAQSIEIPEGKPLIPKVDKEVTIDNEYTKLVINSPAYDSTIHNNAGEVNISIEVNPALANDDKMVVLLDGKQVDKGSGSSFLLSNIDRGTHTLAVAVLNNNEAELIRSDDVIFHLRRASKLFNKEAPVEKKTAPPQSDIPVP